ncbi:MAG: O-antigen ligase family protein [bacterium]|nr:O-antigen ligase family protein [bacterium]
MSKKINLFILILAGFLPLFNGGKGFGAFCVSTILLCGLGIWIIYQLRQNEHVLVPVVSHFNVFVFCFYSLVLLNLFFTVYLWATVIEWIRITGYLIFFLLLSLSAGLDRKAFASLTRNMLFLVVVLSLIEAIVIIYQSYVHVPPRGTMPNENVAASYILIGLMVSLSYLFFNPGVSRLKKMISLLSILTLAVALVVTHSRGILVALVVALGILSKIKFRKWGIVVVSLAVLGVIAFFPLTVFDSIFKINIPYSYRRLAIWQSAWEIIKDRPWLGWGMGNFGLAFPRYNLPSIDSVLHFGKVTRFAHNEFLQVAAEMGLLAMACYTMIIGYVIKTGRNLILNKKVTWTQAATYTSLIGIVVHSLVDFNLHLPAITFMSVMLGTSILLDASAADVHTYDFSASTRKKTGLFLASVLVLTMFFFTGQIFLAKAERAESKKESPAIIIDAYKQAQNFNPLDSYYHEKLARLYARQYQTGHDLISGELAVAEYTRASRLNPEEASLYEDLFYLYYTLGSPLPNMEQNYVQVMSRNPHLVKPTVILALFHMQRRNYGQALQLLSDVISKEPNYLAAYYYLAVCYEFLGDLESARSNFEIIVRKLEQHLERLAQSSYELQALQVPKTDIFTRLGIIYNMERKYVQAADTLEQALALDPDHSEALNALAGTYFSQGQYRLALPYARKAVRLAPKNKEFQHNLDLCLQKVSLPRQD